MANPLSTILQNQNLGLFGSDTPPFKWTGTSDTTPYMINKAPAAPAPAAPVPQTPAPIFKGGAAAPAAAVDLYAKYRDPKTGNVMTPEEYAIYLGNKAPKPKATGDVPQVAGDAMVYPNEPIEDLTKRATNINNARNDIATGTTDPYQAASKSGIAYSPAELKAIESAYAGVYDPAINDVFARLKTKQDEEDKKAAREEQIFATNENIRQWRATTGSKAATGTGTKARAAVETLTPTQLRTAARNAGVTIAAMSDMDSDLANFFVSPPKSEADGTPMDDVFEAQLKNVANGSLSAEDMMTMITDSNLTEAVKHYYIDKIPDDVANSSQKEGFIGKIWGLAGSALKALVGI